MAENLKAFATIGRKVICVGRNYRAHVKEMGNVVTTEPLLFFKPSSAFITEGQKIPTPPGCKDLQHEVELGLVISQRAKNISKSDAMRYIGGYALALDMTARDFQAVAKKAGHPWLLAKGFDGSCPVSKFVPATEVPDPHKLELWCSVNGSIRQRGHTKDMIFDVPFVLEYITKYVTLEPGDLVLTGSPEGVSTLHSNDTVECGFKNEGGSTELVTMKFVVE